MLITFKPAPRTDGPAKIGGLPNELGERVYSFKPNKLPSPVAEAIEDVTGWTFEHFGRQFMSGSMKARRAALWVCLRYVLPGSPAPEFPKLKFDELSFTPDELSVDFDDEELAALRAQLDDDETIDEDTREQIRAVLGEPDEDEVADPKEETAESVD